MYLKLETRHKKNINSGLEQARSDSPFSFLFFLDPFRLHLCACAYCAFMLFRSIIVIENMFVKLRVFQWKFDQMLITDSRWSSPQTNPSHFQFYTFFLFVVVIVVENVFIVWSFTWTGYQSISKEIVQQFIEEYFFGVFSWGEYRL